MGFYVGLTSMNFLNVGNTNTIGGKTTTSGGNGSKSAFYSNQMAARFRPTSNYSILYAFSGEMQPTSIPTFNGPCDETVTPTGPIL